MKRAGFVAIVGRPNAGKSTLLNALAGQKVAIVTAKPQTTRTRIRAVVDYPEGQIVFLDTPGIHKPGHLMNERMLDAVHAAAREADLLVLIVDAAVSFGAGDRYVLDLLREWGKETVLLLNKADLHKDKARLLPVIDRYRGEYGFSEIVPLSALTGEGVEGLPALFLAHLPEGEPLFGPDDFTDRTERDLAAEFVREALINATRDELPYSTGVIVTAFDESRREAGGGVKIEADILVDHDSQKGIVIGRKGAMLVAVGTAARLEMEKAFGCRVYVALHVKVKKKWRDSEAVLDAMGVKDGPP